MVRDLESLIEYVYLRSIGSDLLSKDVIVNPTNRDNIFGKICIINKSYDLPDLRTASAIIDRRVDQYDLKKNPFIKRVDIYQDEVFVLPINNLFYFGPVPESLINYGECYRYLANQLSEIPIRSLPI